MITKSNNLKLQWYVEKGIRCFPMLIITYLNLPKCKAYLRRVKGRWPPEFLIH